MMLVTVTAKKLVLGRQIYKIGDVFECRDAEANLLIASKQLKKSAPGVKATREAPQAPGTGISNNPRKPGVSVKPSLAGRPKPDEINGTNTGALGTSNSPAAASRGVGTAQSSSNTASAALSGASNSPADVASSSSQGAASAARGPSMPQTPQDVRDKETPEDARKQTLTLGSRGAIGASTANQSNSPPVSGSQGSGSTAKRG